MKFDAVNRIAYAKKALPVNALANEASGTMRTVNVDDQSMTVAIITDKMIKDNGLKEVYDPIMFNRGNEPTVGGLFSEKVFGTTPKQIQNNRGYIDLRMKFFHPYVFEVLCKLNTTIKKVASTSTRQAVRWHVDDDGKLIGITDPADKRYNDDNYGIDWLVANYHKLSFKETDSNIRDDRLTLIKSLSDDEIFITKWVVCPVALRNVDRSSGRLSVPEINQMYKNIIKLVRSLDDSEFGFMSKTAMFGIQDTLRKIREYGQSLVHKKKGAFHQTILGKSVDRGARAVISVPTLNGCDKPDDCIVNIIETGVPISKCMELGTQFMMRWILNFFDDQFRNQDTIPVWVKDADGNMKLEDVAIVDHSNIFTEDYIEKKMELFTKTFGEERIETVKITCKDGRKVDMVFTGQGFSRDPGSPYASTLSSRPLTWTDVFYLAAVNTLSDKYLYVTRYPLEDYFGTFPSKLTVLSTIKTMPMVINGTVYQHYPIIDLKQSSEKISQSFIDTVSISNLYLDAIGGDYDGDMVSLKLCYTVEANKEAEESLNDIKHYISIQGNLVRVLGNEAYLTFYNMTKTDPKHKAKPLTPEQKAKLLAIKKEDMSLPLLTKLFATTMDKSKGGFNKIPPKFDLQAPMHLDANEYINKTPIDTTVGIFIFNKIMVEKTVESVVAGGYHNVLINKKGFGSLVDMISTGVMEQKITIKDHLVPWLKWYEFFGMKACTLFSASYTRALLESNSKIQKRKKELLKDSNPKNVAQMMQIEDQLVAEAHEELKDDPGMSLFDSGARGSFDNDYKNMNLMLGPIAVPGEVSKFDMVHSNYIEGLQKKDLVAAGNTVVNSAYPKAVGTQVGGYLTKQFYAVYQSIVLDEDGTDCHTKGTLDITIKDDSLMWQNIMEGETITTLTPDNIGKYMGKKVKLRSPMYCSADKICSVCAGRRFYIMGMKNIGLTAGRISNTFLNKSMKNFHNAKVKMDLVDINKLLQ